MATLLFEENKYKIIGEGMPVHKVLGAEFLESVYLIDLVVEIEIQITKFES